MYNDGNDLLRVTTDSPPLKLNFALEWRWPLEGLQEGEEITIRGKYANVSRNFIELDDCKLIREPGKGKSW